MGYKAIEQGFWRSKDLRAISNNPEPIRSFYNYLLQCPANDSPAGIFIFDIDEMVPQFGWKLGYIEKWIRHLSDLKKVFIDDDMMWIKSQWAWQTGKHINLKISVLKKVMKLRGYKLTSMFVQKYYVELKKSEGTVDGFGNLDDYLCGLKPEGNIMKSRAKTESAARAKATLDDLEAEHDENVKKQIAALSPEEKARREAWLQRRGVAAAEN